MDWTRVSPVRSRPVVSQPGRHSQFRPSSAVTSQALSDPFRPLPIISSKVFQVVFVHSVYNSTLFFPSCCCSLLLHVTATLICIFLVCRQLFQNILILLWSKRLNRQFWKISSRSTSVVFSLFLSVQVHPPYKRMETVRALNNFILKISGPKLI